MNSIKITVLVENTAGRLGVLAEHGLSFLIETGGEKVLFDTGQGFVLKHNLEVLGLNLLDVKSLVLSHGHYDHTGGLIAALSMMNSPTLYAHRAAIEPKFTRNADGSGRFVGLSALLQDALKHSTRIEVATPTQLPGGLRLTGPVPRVTRFEDTGGPFFRDQACTDPDPLDDDQSAFIETEQGTVVVLGCAHAGIINTLNYIQTLTANRPIHTVIGGMHLHSASEERMEKTVEALRTFNIQSIFACHCTGFAAATRLALEFPGQVRICPVGTTITI